MTQRHRKYKSIALALGAIALAGCDRKPPEARKPGPGADTSQSRNQPGSARGTRCDGPITFDSVGAVSGKSLTEISGIVASRSNPGTYWVHNDSGHGPHLYAITATGRHLGTVSLPADAYDWEDIAISKDHAGATHLYVADIGDNFPKRKDGVQLHRFEEPELDTLTRVFPKPAKIEKVDTANLNYPAGPVDAEALLVDAKTEEIVVLTKPRMAPPQVMSLSDWTNEATFRVEGTITEQSAGHELHLVTAADLSPDGRWIAVRTYNEIFVFRRQPKQSMADALLGPACLIQPAREAQGESIGFVFASAASEKTVGVPPFVTVSEGAQPDLFVYGAR